MLGSAAAVDRLFPPQEIPVALVRVAAHFTESQSSRPLPHTSQELGYDVALN